VRSADSASRLMTSRSSHGCASILDAKRTTGDRINRTQKEVVKAWQTAAPSIRRSAPSQEDVRIFGSIVRRAND